jgi:hypothetical protein
MLTLPHEPHDLDEPSMVEPHLGHVECAFATRTGEECILEECVLVIVVVVVVVIVGVLLAGVGELGWRGKVGLISVSAG